METNVDLLVRGLLYYNNYRKIATSKQKRTIELVNNGRFHTRDGLSVWDG